MTNYAKYDVIDPCLLPTISMFSVLYLVLWLHISFLNNQHINNKQQLSQSLNARNIVFIYFLPTYTVTQPFHILYFEENLAPIVIRTIKTDN